MQRLRPARVPIARSRPRRISKVEAESAGRLLTVAIMRKEGGTDLNPSPTVMLMPGDALVVMKRALRK